MSIVGKKYNKLTIISLAHIKNFQKYWKCQCDCGKIKVVYQGHLKNGHTKSCGCLKKEIHKLVHFKHGHKQGKSTPEYRTWQLLKDRCNNINNAKYSRYGGRGISVCARWLDKENGFINFLEDMGEKPEPKKKYSIDRINNNGNYEPNNCRWVTQKEQVHNSSTTVLTKEQVELIRNKYSKGNYTYECLAKEYNTCKSNIESIIKNKTW